MRALARPSPARAPSSAPGPHHHLLSSAWAPVGRAQGFTRSFLDTAALLRRPHCICRPEGWGHGVCVLLTPINEPHPGPGHTGVSGHWAVPGVPLPCAASPLALGALAGPASLWVLRGGSVCRCDSEHRFWKPCEVDAEVDSASVSEALRSRCVAFAGQFEPVQHRCRAPRPDGQLCARQDRLKVGLAWGAHGGRGRAGLRPAGTRTPPVGTGLGHSTSVSASPPMWS